MQADLLFNYAGATTLGTEANGVFRSTDAGQTWGTAGIPGIVGVPQQGYRIDALRIPPLRPDTLYALTSITVFKSTDRGRSWTSSRRGVPGTVVRLRSLAVDPGNPNLLYLGTSDGVFRSLNGGATWQRTAAARVEVPALAVDPLKARAGESRRHRVVRQYRHATRIVADQCRQPPTQFHRCASVERQRNDPLRRDPPDPKQIRDPVDNHPGLARAWPR